MRFHLCLEAEIIHTYPFQRHPHRNTHPSSLALPSSTHPHISHIKVPLPPFQRNKRELSLPQRYPSPNTSSPTASPPHYNSAFFQPTANTPTPLAGRPQRHRFSPSTSALTRRNKPPTASAFHTRTTGSGLKVISNLHPIDTVASHDSRGEDVPKDASWQTGSGG